MVNAFAGGVRDGGVAPFLTDEWNPWEDEQVEYNSALNKKRESFKQQMSLIDKNKPKNHKVQIWGKAAIGKLQRDIGIQILKIDRSFVVCNTVMFSKCAVVVS